jgi:hypothetical protein
LSSSGTQEHKEQEEDDELGLSSSSRAKQQEKEEIDEHFLFVIFWSTRTRRIRREQRAYYEQHLRDVPLPLTIEVRECSIHQHVNVFLHQCANMIVIKQGL